MTIFYLSQKRGNCVAGDCYLCPVLHCSMLTFGLRRVEADTPELVEQIHAKEKSGAIKIVAEITNKDTFKGE